MKRYRQERQRRGGARNGRTGTSSPGRRRAGLERLEHRVLLASDAGAVLANVDSQASHGGETAIVDEASFDPRDAEEAILSRPQAAREPHLLTPERSPRLQPHLIGTLATNTEVVGSGGDYNGDRIISAADYVLVRLHWGAAVDEPLVGWKGMPPDERVDQNELDAVLLNWLQILSQPAEPKALSATETLAGDLASSHADMTAKAEGGLAARDAVFSSLVADGKGSGAQRGGKPTVATGNPDGADPQANGVTDALEAARAAANAEVASTSSYAPSRFEAVPSNQGGHFNSAFASIRARAASAWTK